jgi:predicted membrane chloride channel (bestrophin family)
MCISLELIAEEIEDPLGSDENDLPTHKIAENIKKHVEEFSKIPFCFKKVLKLCSLLTLNLKKH